MHQTTEHDNFMRLALREAEKAAEAGEVPVGAVIVRDGLLIGKAHNQVELLNDPTAHAEIIAITQAAAATGDWRLTGTTLYVTKEPCPMCAGAIVMSRIPAVVFGVKDPLRGGAVSVFNILNHPQLNHRAKVTGGILEEECAQLIKGFSKHAVAAAVIPAPEDSTPLLGNQACGTSPHKHGTRPAGAVGNSGYVDGAGGHIKKDSPGKQCRGCHT